MALLPASESSILALDLETNGTDPSDPDFVVVGIGFADVRACFYVDWRTLPSEVSDYIKAQVQRRPVTAFNVLFDGQALDTEGFGWLNWALCSYGLFFQLAAEGYDQQRWNLETLQREVLGWGGSNKTELAELLSKHGLTKDGMWQLADLEPVPFGRYCGLDAEAAFHAYYELADATFRLGKAGDVLRRYHKEDFMTEVKLLSEQQLRGIQVNVPKLRQYYGMTWLTVQEDRLSFLSHPEVREYVDEYNAAVVTAHQAAEPPRTTKAGAHTKRWENWERNLRELAARNHFNPGSGKQLAWLFFERLGLAPRKYTDSGAPSVDKEVLPFLGKSGKFLSDVRKREKLLSYVSACLEKQRDGVLHFACKSVGTVTGRISGGEGDNE